MKNLAIAVALGLALVPRAQADLILSFTPNGSSTDFFVSAGQTIQIPVYIVQRNQAPLTTILSDEGLISGGVKINFTNTIPGGAMATAAASNPSFDSNASGFPFFNNGTGMAGISAGTTGPNVPTTGSPPAIQVGTFTFQGVTPGNVVNIGTTNPHPSSFGEFVTGTFPNFIQLETQPFANIFWAGGNTAMPISYTTTITVTPEPTLILCTGIPALGYVAWRRRKRVE